MALALVIYVMVLAMPSRSVSRFLKDLAEYLWYGDGFAPPRRAWFFTRYRIDWLPIAVRRIVEGKPSFFFD